MTPAPSASVADTAAACCSSRPPKRPRRAPALLPTPQRYVGIDARRQEGDDAQCRRVPAWLRSLHGRRRDRGGRFRRGVFGVRYGGHLLGRLGGIRLRLLGLLLTLHGRCDAHAALTLHLHTRNLVVVKMLLAEEMQRRRLRKATEDDDRDVAKHTLRNLPQQPRIPHLHATASTQQPPDCSQTPCRKCTKCPSRSKCSRSAAKSSNEAAPACEPAPPRPDCGPSPRNGSAPPPPAKC